MLQKLFDWFDDAASRVLRIAYLIPFVIATAIYFGGKVPGFVQDFVEGALPWVLAFAVETQTYVSVRKLAVIWAALKADTLEDFQRKRLVKDMWMQIATVFGLSAFSVWNQASYLSETWTPTPMFGWPRWVDILVRAVGPAVFFFLTAFAAPLAKTLGEKLSEEAHRTLEAFLGVLTNQRKRVIKEIDGRIVDMGEPILTVANAANEKRSGALIATVQGALTRLSTGEASPQLSLPAPKARSTTGRNTTSRLEDSRAVYRYGMPKEELARQVGVSVKTAGRHIAILNAEKPAPFPITTKR